MSVWIPSTCRILNEKLKSNILNESDIILEINNRGELNNNNMLGLLGSLACVLGVHCLTNKILCLGQRIVTEFINILYLIFFDLCCVKGMLLGYKGDEKI